MSATFWHVIIAGILALAAVLIFLDRRGIRARFRRNMPGPRFAGANRNPPPPCVPIQRPLPAERPVHGELPNGGPCRACLADELAKRESAGGVQNFPPGAAIVAGEPVTVGEDGKIRPIEKREPKL